MFPHSPLLRKSSYFKEREILFPSYLFTDSIQIQDSLDRRLLTLFPRVTVFVVSPSVQPDVSIRRQPPFHTFNSPTMSRKGVGLRGGKTSGKTR